MLSLFLGRTSFLCVIYAIDSSLFLFYRGYNPRRMFGEHKESLDLPVQ